MTLNRIYFYYLKNTSANACELRRTEKKTAYLGGFVGFVLFSGLAGVKNRHLAVSGLKIDVHCVIEFGMGDIQHALKILFVFGQFQNGNDGRQMLAQFGVSHVVC